MSKGKVKEYSADKGCGVIIDSEIGQPLTVYANYTSLKQGEVLKGGQDVEYEIENNRHGNWAINVKIVQ